MFMTKLKIVLMFALVFGIFVTGAGVIAYRGARAQTPPEQGNNLPRKKSFFGGRSVQDAKQAQPKPADAAKEPSFPDIPADKIRAMLAGIKDSDKMKTLLQEQYEAAHTEAVARWQEFLAGRGTLELYYITCRRLVQAELDLSSKKEDRIAVLEAELQRLKEVEATNKHRFEAGQIDIADYSVSRFKRIRAEIMLERAKAGRSVPDLVD